MIYMAEAGGGGADLLVTSRTEDHTQMQRRMNPNIQLAILCRAPRGQHLARHAHDKLHSVFHRCGLEQSMELPCRRRHNRSDTEWASIRQ